MENADYKSLFTGYFLGRLTKKEKDMLANQKQNASSEKILIPKYVCDSSPVSIPNSEYKRLKDVERKYNEYIESKEK